MIEFSDRAGKGFSDMWIRKEIHDMIRTEKIIAKKTVFLTCDLMNSMAAEAEVLTSCYFSRYPQEYYALKRYEGQFFDFVMANAVVFGKIKIELLDGNGTLKGSHIIESVWNGKTTAEWYSDCLRVDVIK